MRLKQTRLDDRLLVEGKEFTTKTKLYTMLSLI